MSSIDQEFVEFVVKSLVSQPDKVQVERRIDEKGVLLELTVDPEDLGRVIGKRGATAQSLRTLLRALGTKNDARYNLKIIDNGVGGNHSSDDGRPAAPSPAEDSNSTAETLPAPVTDETAPASSATTDDEVTTSTDEAPAPDAPASEGATKEAKANSDRLSQHRRELEEFDDLDI